MPRQWYHHDRCEKDRPKLGPEYFVNIQPFLYKLKHSITLTRQQRQTLYGQAVHGDIDGAMRGYEKLTRV